MGHISEIIGLIVIYIWISIRDLLTRNINIREFINCIYEASYNSILIVILTNLSIGMVSSLQLTKYFVGFGMGSEIGGSAATALIKELAPLITAIVLIGRICSAWAAEIGSMKMTEQISALKVMKIDLHYFLISPRIWSCILAMPVLNLVAILSGLMGGYIVAILMTDLDLLTFIDSIKRYISFYSVCVSMIKSIVFGSVIAAIACLYGLKANGGAIGVGRYTTKAVVSALICLFFINYTLSYIFFSLL